MVAHRNMATIINNGVYGIPEAARILGVPQQRVRAWFGGWPSRGDALLRSDYKRKHGQYTISFLNLVDAAVATTLKEKHGVSTQMLRKLRLKLSQAWHTEHPFAREEFFTDDSGREVFCRLATEEEASPPLLEILNQQFAIPQILLPFLKQVDYSGDTRYASLIKLMGRVVLDPTRKYGKPIVRESGMPTALLNDCFVATQSVDVVADWYNVAPEDVQEAVEFETEYAGLAA